MRLVIAVLLLVFCAACVIKALRWAFIPRSALPRNRVRHQMIRLHLRLHPGRGHATAVELHRHWGRLASARKARYARPSLSRCERLLHPGEHSVMVGRAHYGHALRLPVEEHAVIFSPPRKGKSGWLSSVILRYPGPVLSTTTRADVYKDTVRVRGRLGRIDVFNPQGVGRVPSTMTWDPIAGCQDPSVAIRRADAFAGAVSAAGRRRRHFLGPEVQRLPASTVFRGGLRPQPGRCATAWRRPPGGRCPAPARKRRTSCRTPARTTGQRRSRSCGAKPRRQPRRSACTCRSALGFLFDPALAQAVNPREDGPGLSLESFVRQQATLYMIATGPG